MMRNISGFENKVQQKQASTGLTPKTVKLLLRYLHFKFQFFLFQFSLQTVDHAPVLRLNKEMHSDFNYISNPV